ncbi:hypothetical protein [Leptospira borgpetersenii]|uniref:hypothetical protein n=1 Tax=Leptospira borgpetersenii TaxID=174 RepID=UPI001E4D7416|nr:hypothetical protein [Leptospira borgpetersenii]
MLKSSSKVGGTYSEAKSDSLERVPKPFDLIRILADRCNCSYVLGQALNCFPIANKFSVQTR